MVRCLFLWAAVLASCSGSRSASPPGAEPTTTSTSATTEADQGSTATPSGAPAETGPAPVLAIRGRPSRAGGEVAITLENRGESLARVASRLVLERAEGGDRFAPVRGVELALRDSCARDAPACVELAPGAALHPPPWRGTTGEGGGQCRCEGCAPAQPGTYRLVATSCGGGHRVLGEVFEIGR